MENIFLAVLDMSFKASFLILAVVLLRLVLKHSPRYIICLMWLLVGLRLVLPFSVESTLSLIPQREDFPSVSTEQIQPTTQVSAESDYTPVISTPVETPEPQTPVTVPVAPVQPSVTEPAKEPLTAAQTAAIVWLCGLAAMLVYLAVSYLLLRRRLAEAVPVGDGVWKCTSVRSPFVLGFFLPRVYISYGMNDEQTAYVLAHERAHIARRDHWTKPIGFAILALHWFNPLVWLTYVLLCRDIELACDERVVKSMTLPERKGYSEALLLCSVKASPLTACPLAFGEAGVKQRIKSVLHYKKPAFWIIIAAVVCCVAAAVFFLTDPREEPDFDCPEEVQSLVYDFLDACTVDPEEALPYRYLPTEEMEEFYSTGRRVRSYEVESISPINELLYSFIYSAKLESDPGSEYAQKYGRFQSLDVVNYAVFIDGQWQVISEFEDIPDYILRGEEGPDTLTEPETDAGSPALGLLLNLGWQTDVIINGDISDVVIDSYVDAKYSFLDFYNYGCSLVGNEAPAMDPDRSVVISYNTGWQLLLWENYDNIILVDEQGGTYVISHPDYSFDKTLKWAIYQQTLESVPAEIADYITGVLTARFTELPLYAELSRATDYYYSDYDGSAEQVILDYPSDWTCSGTCGIDGVFYWRDESGKATPTLAAMELHRIMLEALQALPEENRLFTLEEFKVLPVEPVDYAAMVTYHARSCWAGILLGNYEGLSYTQAAEKYATNLIENFLHTEDRSLMALREDMWYLDPMARLKFEGWCNMYRSDEMEFLGFVGADGFSYEVQQGSGGMYKYILMRSGNVWRLELVSHLEDALAPTEEEPRRAG